MKDNEKKFLVQGFDSFSHEEFSVGRYATAEEAIAVANARGGQMTLMFVHDENDNIIHRAGSW